MQTAIPGQVSSTLASAIMKILLKPENEAEAIAIKNLLEDNSIHAVIQSFHDTAYNGLYQTQYGWGVIKVHENDYQKAKDIIKDWKDNAPDSQDIDFQTNQSSGRQNNSQKRFDFLKLWKLIIPLVLIGSVLLNIFFIGRDFFSSQASYETKYKEYDANNILLSKVDWKDNRRSPYEYISYSTNGRTTTESYDTNDDGRVDKFIAYYPQSHTIYLDKNNNGIFEVSNEVFNSGSTITNNDNDENGIYENSVINIRKGQAVYHLLNSNTNGYTQRITTPDGANVDLGILKEISTQL